MNNEVGFRDMLSQFFARRPKDVDGVANTSNMYYREYLLKKIFSRIKFIIPPYWDYDYFITHLFVDGHIAITDTEIGVIALQCGVTGLNVYNHPTECIFANPVLGNFTRKIGADCEVIKLQYDWQGCMKIVNRYAVLLSMCDSSIAVNLMNTKAAYVFGATSKAQAQSYKKMYDDISCGEPAVFVNSDGISRENMFVMPAKQNYIADDIQLLKRKIVNEFLTEIGINNTNTDKRERLTDDEVNANNDETMFNIMHWYDNIKEGIEKVNTMFPDLNLSCEIRKFAEGGENNVNTEQTA